MGQRPLIYLNCYFISFFRTGWKRQMGQSSFILFKMLYMLSLGQEIGARNPSNLEII